MKFKSIPERIIEERGAALGDIDWSEIEVPQKIDELRQYKKSF